MQCGSRLPQMLSRVSQSQTRPDTHLDSPTSVWNGKAVTTNSAFNTARGAASNFSSSLDNPTPYLNRSRRFLVTEQLVIQPNKRFAIMPIAVYQRHKDGIPLHGTGRWLSFRRAAGGLFYRSCFTSCRGGFDRVWSGQHLYNGWLRKFTIAPEIGSGREFFSRPVLRLFLTYGNWSDGLMGYVGGIPYQNKTNGVTYGVQAETWW